MQKTLILFLLVSLSGLACKQQIVMEKAVSGSEPVEFSGPVPSIYDSITPPKLITDSSKLYKELNKLLLFSNNLKWEDEISFTTCFVTIGRNGKIQSKGCKSSNPIETEMIKVTDYLLANLSEWEPAYKKAEPNEKLQVLARISFFFYKNEIKFDVESSSYYFLRKSFKRPIALN